MPDNIPHYRAVSKGEARITPRNVEDGKGNDIDITLSFRVRPEDEDEVLDRLSAVIDHWSL